MSHNPETEDQPMEPREPMRHAVREQQPRCGAKTRAGGECSKAAGWGTDHLGWGHCKFHGGQSPNGAVHAARQAGKAAAQELALAVGVDLQPDEALIACVQLAAAEVRYYTDRIAELSPDAVMVRPRHEAMGGKDGRVADLRQAETLHPWIRARHAAMDRLARWSKLALDGQVSARRAAVVDEYGAAIARLLDGVLGDLDLSEAQRAQAERSVPARLAQVTSTTTEQAL